MEIPAFVAITLLPPQQETFKCFKVYGKNYRRDERDLEGVSELASTHYSANLGYRKTAKSKQLGFRLGVFFFPVTKARVDKMLKPYNLKVSKKNPFTDTKG